VLELLKMLEGRDRRSIGRVDKAAAMVEKSPRLFGRLIDGLWSENALVRMRAADAADAAEKVTRKRPELLAAYKKELVGLLVETEQLEVRRHLAAMVPRLELNAKQRRAALHVLQRYLEDRSSIVKTFALEGLVELTGEDAQLRAGVVENLREAVRSGTAAMKARARKLLRKTEIGEELYARSAEVEQNALTLYREVLTLGVGWRNENMNSERRRCG
jgi:hypothetical protein